MKSNKAEISVHQIIFYDLATEGLLQMVMYSGLKKIASSRMLAWEVISQHILSLFILSVERHVAHQWVH